MRAWLLGLVAIGVAIAVILWVRRSGDEPAKPKEPAAVASGSAMGRGDVPAPSGGPVQHVRKLEPEQRKQLAEQIAAARARARAAAVGAGGGAGHGAGGAGSGPEDDTITVEQVSKSVKAAFEEAIPVLATCYDKRPPEQKTAAVQMVMYSDPSIGTVIDTNEMHDSDGKPLPRELDDCLRTTIEQLALPPLEVGGHLPLQYSFRFD